MKDWSKTTHPILEGFCLQSFLPHLKFNTSQSAIVDLFCISDRNYLRTGRWIFVGYLSQFILKMYFLTAIICARVRWIF